MKVFKKVMILGLALTAIGSTAAFGCDMDQQYTSGNPATTKVVASQGSTQTTSTQSTAGSADTNQK